MLMLAARCQCGGGQDGDEVSWPVQHSKRAAHHQRMYMLVAYVKAKNSSVAVQETLSEACWAITLVPT